MLVILPVISLIFLFLIVYRKENVFRHAVLSSTILWGFLLTIMTEGLSLIHFLNLGGVVGLWGLSNIILIFIYLKSPNQRKPFFLINLRNFLQNFSRSSQVLLLGISLIIITVGITALIAAPNNWDSMTYHLPRILHWQQNQNINHYPTHELRQLYQAPWSEFVMLHLQILSGSDRFANGVQWFSMVGSILGVSLIAQRLGADEKGQILAAVFAVTIPMGILQASSTQNDYVTSFWLVCLTYFILLRVQGERSLLNLCQLSISLGLAILTKGTAYIYSVPLMAWFLITEFKSLKWRIGQSILIGSTLVLLINLGYYIRNYLLFGSFLFTGNKTYKNEIFSLTFFLSNLIRNIGLHLRNPIQSINGFVQQFSEFLHQLLRVDINDPRTTWMGTTFKIDAAGLLHEDTAANTIHILLIFCTLLFLILERKNKLKKYSYLLTYAIVITSLFLLFCFLLKWQPWHSRLHLPIFLLFSPLIGTVFSEIFPRSVINCLAILLISLSIPWTFYNQTRPIISESQSIFKTNRVDQYFYNRQDLKQPYLDVAEYLKSHQCSQVGLSLQQDAWEYPWWILMSSQTAIPLRMESVNVSNISSEAAKVERPHNFNPCAIISLDTHPDISNAEIITTSTANYRLAFVSKPIKVFLQQESSKND